MHVYELFGLRVASELPLPELRASSVDGCDVSIRRGRLPPVSGEQAGLSVEGEGVARLFIPGVGRYRMTTDEMIVDPDPAASDRNVRLYLLGSAFAAILHQRGLLPLHANAVDIAGRAVAFLGHPGAGKSTLAAWFHDRGFAVLADDVCVVTAEPPSRPLAHAGIPRLRLWREALEASGRKTDDYEMSFDDWDKYNVPTGAAPGPAALPLSHVYLLDRAQAEGPSVERLTGAAAVEALVANTYRGAYVPLMGRTAEHLLACARLAARIPVFRASRRWGLDEMDEEARALEAHARSVIAAG